MNQACFIGCSFNHSRNASFIRVCQPFPVALNAARTSRSKRTVCESLTPLPSLRPGFLASISSTTSFLNKCGRTSEAGRKCLKSSFVNSRTSPSLSVNGKRFAIFITFPSVCSAKADYSDCISDGGKTKNMKTVFKISDSNIPDFRIIITGIDSDLSRPPFEIRGPIKRQATLC